jgi:Fic family protein
MFEPRFNITNKLLNQIAAIEALREKVAYSRILPERQTDIRYRASIEQIHTSTSIEGNPLTPEQVKAALSDRSMTRQEYAVLEVRNYKKALDHIERRKFSDRPFSTKDLLMIHHLAMQGLLSESKAGAFRKGAVYIVDQDDHVKYTGPSAKNVRKLTDDLFRWLDSAAADVHSCVVAAILHYQLVTIHPFADGNGRTARLAVMLFLGMRGYDFNASIVLDSYYAQDKREYYAALHQCQGASYDGKEDITSWIEYFTDGFLSSAKVLSAEIEILSLLISPTESVKLSSDETDILSYAKQFGSLTVNDACEILARAPRRTVQRRLKKLVEAGLLAVSGEGRNTRYQWRE